MAEKVVQRSVSVRIDGKEVENSLKKIQGAVNSLYNEVAKLPKGTELYEEKLQELNRVRPILEEHRKEIRGIENAWHKNIPSINAAIAATAGLFAIDSVKDYTRELYKAGVQIDNISRKSVFVLKEQLAGVNQEAKKNATEIGLAREQYVGLATDVTAFLQSQKFSRAEAAKMSTEVVNLSGVLSQFQGGGLEKTHEALEAIKGAFAEDVEQLAKFNIAISENVVQAKMQELGLDKANAAAQQHGRAMIILKMITKGAKAQNEAFTGSADGMVRSQARIEAMLQTVSNNLAKFFIPLFEKALIVVTPVIEYLGVFAEKLSGLVNPAKAASDAFYEQKENVTQLEKKLPDLLKKYDELSAKSKLNKKEQTLLKDVIVQIGEVVPTAKIEVDNYGKALKINANSAREFLAAQKTLSEYLNRDAIAAEEKNIKLLEYQQKAIKESIEGINNGKIKGEAGIFGVNYEKDLNAKTKAVQRYSAELSNASKVLEGAQLNLKRLKGESIVETKSPDVVDMSGVSPADKKAEDETLKHLQKLREAVADHYADVKALDENNEAQAVARIQEKYRKDIELALDLEKKKGKVGSEAHKLKKQLESQRDAEILDIYQDSLDKTLDSLEKFYDAANSKRLTDQEREAQQIAEKYQKDIETVTRIEKDVTNVKETERSRAHQLRLQLEEARDKEILDAQALRAAEALQKESDESAKFLAERQKSREALQKQIQEELNKPLENQGNNPNETTPQYIQRMLSAQELEKQQLRFHFEELLKMAEDFGIDTAALKEKQKQQEAAIDEKYKTLTIKRQAEENQKKMQAYSTLFNELGGLATAFGELMGAQGEEQSAFQKVLTLAQIAFDTAAAISALTANSEKNPANAATFGIAGTIQFATGLARIITNIAKAKQVLSTAPKVKQKFEGGEVIGAQDGKVYNPEYAGEARTGMVRRPTLFLTGEGNIPEYVIAGPELKIPEVANFLPFIEAKRRQRVRGFADGGAVSDTNTRSNSGLSPQFIGTPNNNQGLQETVLLKMMETLEKMNQSLEKGVIFTFEHLVELGKMQVQLEEVRK